MFNVQRFGDSDSDILKNSWLFNVTFEYEATIDYLWMASVIIWLKLNKHSLRPSPTLDSRRICIKW